MSFLKQSTIYGLSGAFGALSYLVVTPIFTRSLPQSEFATLSVYLTVFGLICILANAEILSSVSREYFTESSKSKLSSLISTAFFLKTMSTLLVTAGILLFIFLTNHFGFYPGFELSYSLILPTLFAMWVFQLSQFQLLLLRFAGNANRYLLISASQALTYVLLSLCAIYFFEFNVMIAIWCLGCSYLIGATVFLIENRKNLGRSELELSKRILKYSLPIIPAVLLGWTINQYSILIMPKMLSLEELASYSIATRIAMIFMLAATAFRLTWDRYASSWFNEPGSEELFAFSADFVIFMGLIIVGMITISSDILFSILAPPNYTKSWETVALVCLAFLWETSSHVYSSGNAWSRKTYKNSYSTIIGLTISLFSTIILHTYLGSLAFALGALLGMITKTTLTIKLANQSHYIPFHKLSFYLLLSTSIFLIIYCLASHNSRIGITAEPIHNIIIGTLFIVTSFVILRPAKSFLKLSA